MDKVCFWRVAHGHADDDAARTYTPFYIDREAEAAEAAQAEALRREREEGIADLSLTAPQMSSAWAQDESPPPPKPPAELPPLEPPFAWNGGNCLVTVCARHDGPIMRARRRLTATALPAAHHVARLPAAQPVAGTHAPAAHAAAPSR